MNLQFLFRNLFHFIIKGNKRDRAEVGKQWMYLLVRSEFLNPVPVSLPHDNKAKGATDLSGKLY